MFIEALQKNSNILETLGVLNFISILRGYSLGLNVDTLISIYILYAFKVDCSLLKSDKTFRNV